MTDIITDTELGKLEKDIQEGDINTPDKCDPQDCEACRTLCFDVPRMIVTMKQMRAALWEMRLRCSFYVPTMDMTCDKCRLEECPVKEMFRKLKGEGVEGEYKNTDKQPRNIQGKTIRGAKE